MFGIGKIIRMLSIVDVRLEGFINVNKARHDEISSRLDVIEKLVNVKPKKEPTKVVDGIIFHENSLKMSKGKWFDLIRKSDGVFVDSPGFETEDEAVEFARKVAAAYPMDEFYVIAPVKVVKANIPVTENDF